MPYLNLKLNTNSCLGLRGRYLIDGLASKPLAAFSLRLLSSSYLGNAIQVVRSSDSTTKDIGFTIDGNLDTASLLTFVGSGTGTISIWYDQSGNGNNGVQPTPAYRYTIVNAGVLNTQNSKPALATAGRGHVVTTTNFGTTGSMSLNSVVTFASSPQALKNVIGSSNNTVIVTTAVTTGALGMYQPSYVSSFVPTANSSFISTAVFTPLNPYLYVNGTAYSSSWSFSGSMTTLVVGSASATPYNNGFTGNMQEGLFFNTNINGSDRTKIDHDQEIYYGIAGI